MAVSSLHLSHSEIHELVARTERSSSQDTPSNGISSFSHRSFRRFCVSSLPFSTKSQARLVKSGSSGSNINFLLIQKTIAVETGISNRLCHVRIPDLEIDRSAGYLGWLHNRNAEIQWDAYLLSR